MNSQVNIQWRSSLLAFSLQFLLTSARLVGDNICLTQKTYLVNVTEYYMRNVTVRDYQWCYNVPPRCSFYTSQRINDTRIVEKNQTRTIENCCPGYVQINDRCVNDCTRCEKGVCEDGLCVCFPGFKGTTCEIACDIGEWGTNCSRECDCDHQTCDSIDGCEKQTETTENSTTLYSSTTPTAEETSPSMTFATNTTQNISEKRTPSHGKETQPIVSSVHPQELQRETRNDSVSGPKMEARREQIDESDSDVEAEEGYRIPVDIMFGDQLQQEWSQFSTTTDRTTQTTRDYFRAIVKPYRHNFQTSTLNIYLKLIVPIFALVILIIVILGIYFVSIMGERKVKRQKDEVPAIRTTSILNDPLPDPPNNEEAVKLTSVEYRSTNQIGAPIFETRVVCDIEKTSECPKSDCEEMLYDHPRPSNSCKATSLANPKDVSKTAATEPIYDEVLFENMFLYIH